MISVENTEVVGIVSMVTDSSQVESRICVDCFNNCVDSGDCQDSSGDDEEN